MMVLKKPLFQFLKTVLLLTTIFIESAFISSSQAMMDLDQIVEDMDPSYSIKKKRQNQGVSTSKKDKITALRVSCKETENFQGRIELPPSSFPSPMTLQTKVISQLEPMDTLDYEKGKKQEGKPHLIPLANVPSTCPQQKQSNKRKGVIASVNSTKNHTPFLFIEETFSKMSPQKQKECILKDVLNPRFTTWRAVAEKNYITEHILAALRKEFGCSNMDITSLRCRLTQESKKAGKSPQDYVCDLCKAI